MEEGAGRRQDTFGLREIGLNLSTTQGDAASMMYTQDSTVDTVMQPIGVATSRDDPALEDRQAPPEEHAQGHALLPGQGAEVGQVRRRRRRQGLRRVAAAPRRRARRHQDGAPRRRRRPRRLLQNRGGGSARRPSC